MIHLVQDLPSQQRRLLPPHTPVVHHLKTVHDWQRLLCLPIADQVPPELPAHAGQKQKKKRVQRDFQETARWEHDEHLEDDIEDFICSELKIVYNRAGLTFLPGTHKRRDESFCNGQHLGYRQGLHNQHNPQMSSVGALQMPL